MNNSFKLLSNLKKVKVKELFDSNLSKVKSDVEI